MRPTLEGLEQLLQEYRAKLETYFRAAYQNYWWGPVHDPMLVHKLHVEAHYAGEIYHGALRGVFA